MLGTIFGLSLLLIVTHAAAAILGMLFLRPLLAKLPFVGKLL